MIPNDFALVDTLPSVVAANARERQTDLDYLSEATKRQGLSIAADVDLQRAQESYARREKERTAREAKAKRSDAKANRDRLVEMWREHVRTTTAEDLEATQRQLDAARQACEGLLAIRRAFRDRDSRASNLANDLREELFQKFGTTDLDLVVGVSDRLRVPPIHGESVKQLEQLVRDLSHRLGSLSCSGQ